MIYWTDCPLCGEGHPLLGTENGDIFFCKVEQAVPPLFKGKWYLLLPDGLIVVYKMKGGQGA